MNLIKKTLAPSIITTISISCFFLSSLAAATSESISVTNRSTQVISVQSPPINFIVEPTTKITKYVKHLSVQKEHLWSWTPTAMEDSTITITSENNMPICTVKTHYSISHNMQIESDNPEKCNAIIEYFQYEPDFLVDIIVS